MAVHLRTVSSKEQPECVDAKNRQSMKFLRVLLDAIPCPVFIKDREGRFVLANRACAKLCGVVDTADLIGKRSNELPAFSEGLEASLEADRRVLEHREEVRVPLQSVTDADGSVRWLQIQKVPIAASKGDELNVLEIAVDITERVLGEQRIEAAAKEILDLYDNAPCGYHSLDAEALIIQMNDTELEWLGYTRDEMVGKMHFTDLVPKDYFESFWNNYRRFQESGTLIDHEVVLLRKDGTTFPVVVTSKAVRDENGRYVRNRSTLFDLSDRKAAERSVQQAMEEAERANLAKSEFLSRISHELRTPLNAIIGFAQILEFEGHGESVTQAVQHILRGGRHLLSMINEILDVSQIDTASLSVSLEPVELDGVLREVVGFVAPLAADFNVSIRLINEGSENLHILADRQRLKQICINLLSNAIKYNIEGGFVEVSHLIVGDRIRISIADTGRGIAPERERDLFSPFARLGAENLGIEGTGLGLVLSRGLAEYMRGSLTYERNEPTGSVFVIELAAAEKQRAAHAEQIVGTPIGFRPDSRKTILLIEDNLSNVALVERVLKDCGNVELLVATTGREGIEMASDRPPDLVLLDVNLPDMSGLDVLRTFQGSEILRELKVVVTSADATEKQIAAMLRAGALEYLTKPLDVAQLYQVLGNLLDSGNQAA